MSAFLSKIMRVEVKGGDAIANNRVDGKSNTGTYFICSTKDWHKFESFVPDDKSIKYLLDLDRIEIYKNAFVRLFYPLRNKYPDEMRDFEPYCDSLCCYVENPEVIFTTRKNDSRVFLKFDNNCKSDLEKQFRDILYADLSLIVFEMIDDHTCMIYPEINPKAILKEEL